MTAKQTEKRSDATRRRILEAAKGRFSRESYDGVGVRDLARDAGVDAALIVRYFGSKEGLFREIAQSAFTVGELVQGDIETLPERALGLLTAEVDDAAWRTGYDPFRLLLCAVGSATAGPIVAECFDRGFVQPLAAVLRGEQTGARAALIASYILGFALVRVALASPVADGDGRETVKRLLGEALGACVNT